MLTARLGVAVIALVFAAGVQAASQQRPSQHADKSKSQESPTAKQADGYRQGTEEQPFVVKRLDAEETAGRREQTRAEREEKSDNERRLVVWTIVLGGATVSLSLVAFAQLAMFWKQLGLMKVGIDDAKTVADAAKTNADLARKEFIAAHRPRMIVRKLAWIMDAAGSHVGINYAIKNVGDGPGTVIAISAKVLSAGSKEDLPPVPSYVAAIERAIALKSGDWIDCRHTMDSGLINDLALIIGFENIRRADPTPNILFFGYIDYVDNDGRKFQTGFLRRFNFEVSRFEPVPNPDYEYED